MDNKIILYKNTLYKIVRKLSMVNFYDYFESNFEIRTSKISFNLNDDKDSKLLTILLNQCKFIELENIDMVYSECLRNRYIEAMMRTVPKETIVMHEKIHLKNLNEIIDKFISLVSSQIYSSVSEAKTGICIGFDTIEEKTITQENKYKVFYQNCEISEESGSNFVKTFKDYILYIFEKYIDPLSLTKLDSKVLNDEYLEDSSAEEFLLYYSSRSNLETYLIEKCQKIYPMFKFSAKWETEGFLPCIYFDVTDFSGIKNMNDLLL